MGTHPTTLANEMLQLASGEQLAYYDSGTPASDHTPAPAVLLLHGYCGSSAYWEETLAGLSSSVRLLVPDLRGHGASSAPADSAYAMEDFAADLLELLNHVQLPQAYIIGHSLGGYITLAIAEQAPERLRGFALVHSTAHSDSDEAKGKRDAAARTIREHGVDSFVDALVPKLFAPGQVEAMPHKLQLAREIGYATQAEGAAATALGMKGRPDRNRVLRDTTLPALLVAGAADQVISPERTFSVSRSGLQTVQIEGVGHMSMLEKPEALVRTLKDWLETAEAAR